MSHDQGHRYEWHTIPWRKLAVRVCKLQRRISQATTRGETQKARKLQKLLAASWSAKSLAVRRVTQENTGKKTAGVDGIKSLTPPQRLQLISALDLHEPAKPVRRIWIPKPGKLEERPVTVQVVTTGITPQLATSARLREAEKELLHPVRRLHTQWSGTPRHYAAVASTWPRPSSCFRQSASPPRSACQSSPYARARRDGSPSQPYYSSVQRLRPARMSTTPHAASGCPDTSPRSGAHHIGCPLPITARPLGEVGSCRSETSSVAVCPGAPDATT